MKNDIHNIKNIINEQLTEKKRRLEEKQEKERLQEFKDLCKYTINTTIQQNIDRGISLNEIYNNRDYIIKTIYEDLSSRTEEILDKNSFDADKTIKIKKYNYKDFVMLDYLNNYFDSEFSKAQKREKQKQKILKESMQDNLFNYLKEYIEERPTDLTEDEVIFGLHSVIQKDKVIDELASNYEEREYYNNNYYNILNKIKKMYNYKKPTYKEKDEKLSLAWKILAVRKGLKVLFK